MVEIDELYRESKVFAMPSLFEGTGLSALDALNHHCNILITNRGGVDNYFDENAYFVEPTS
ncbi:glycosyltransferase, partial [Vibrio ponticus]